jgi:hypothetical protein
MSKKGRRKRRRSQPRSREGRQAKNTGSLTQEEAEAFREHIDQIEVSAIPIGDFSSQQLATLVRSHDDKHEFDGGVVDDELPILGFRLRDFDALTPEADEISFLAWVWDGFFGTSMTVTLFHRIAKPTSHARVFFPDHDPVARQIQETGRFRAVFLRNNEPEAAFSVSMPVDHRFKHNLTRQKELYATHSCTVRDSGALFWEHLSPHWDSQTTPPHQLSISWMEAYRTLLRGVLQQLDWYNDEAPREQRERSDIAPVLQPLFDAVAGDRSQIVDAISQPFEHIFSDPENVAAFWDGTRALVHPDLERQRSWLPLRCLDSYLWSSKMTDCGHQVPWYSFNSRVVERMSLDAAAVHSAGAGKDYWQRILIFHPSLRFDWGGLVDGKQVPISPSHFKQKLTDVPKKNRGSAARVDKTLQDATNLSGTNLVDRATVPLACGPFRQADIVQTSHDVLVVWRTIDGEYLIVAVNPAHSTWSLVDWDMLSQLSEGVGVSKRKAESFDAAAKAVIAEAILGLRSQGGSPLVDPGNWSASDIREEARRVDRRKERSQYHCAIWIPQAVRPADLYAYLKARFGEPNGMMSVLRNPSSDNIFHWQYNVLADDDFMSIKASTSRIECWASTSAPLSLGEQGLIIENIKNDFGRHGRQLSEVRDQLEEWVLFTNPFAHVGSIVTESEKELLELNVAMPAPVVGYIQQDEVPQYAERRRIWARNCHRAFVLANTIRMLAPVWGEAFVNLVIFAFAKESIKGDVRLYEDVVRRQIDIRIRELHLTCDHFRSGIDAIHSAFQDFHTLMNRRNDALHGNVNPQKLKVDEVLFDGYVPLFRDTRTLEEQVAHDSVQTSDIPGALAGIGVVRRFVDYVIHNLEPPAGNELRRLLQVNPVGFRPATGRLGLLFGPVTADILPVVGSPGPGQID